MGLSKLDLRVREKRLKLDPPALELTESKQCSAQAIFTGFLCFFVSFSGFCAKQ